MHRFYAISLPEARQGSQVEEDEEQPGLIFITKLRRTTAGEELHGHIQNLHAREYLEACGMVLRGDRAPRHTVEVARMNELVWGDLEKRERGGSMGFWVGFLGAGGANMYEKRGLP